MSTVTEEAGIGMFVLVIALIIACIVAVSIVRSLRFILSERDGRRQRTRQIGRVAMRRTLVGIVTMTAIVVGWRYHEDAQSRSSVNLTDCDHEQSADGQYTASTCYAG